MIKRENFKSAFRIGLVSMLGAGLFMFGMKVGKEKTDEAYQNMLPRTVIERSVPFRAYETKISGDDRIFLLLDYFGGGGDALMVRERNEKNGEECFTTYSFYKSVNTRGISGYSPGPLPSNDEKERRIKEKLREYDRVEGKR